MHVPLHDARVRSALRGGMVAVATAVSLSLAAGYGAHAASGGPALIHAVVIVSSSAAVALAVIDESRLAGDPDVDRLDHDRRRSAGPGPSVGNLLRGAGLPCTVGAEILGRRQAAAMPPAPEPMLAT